MDGSVQCLLTCETEGFADEVVEAVRSGGCEAEMMVVHGCSAFQHALDTRSWDLVITECSRAKSASSLFSSEKVLSFVTVHHSALPVVVISSVECLQSALTFMGKGAVDCVRKDELFRLAPVLQREVLRVRRSREMTTLQQRHDMLLNVAAEGFWDWNLATGEMFFSDRWLEMLGYDHQDFQPSFTSWLGMIHPDDLGFYLEVWTDYMEGKTPQFRVEYRMLAKNGDYHWVSARGASVGQEGSEPLYLAGSLNDISDRKAVEQELLSHRQRLEQSIAERTSELRFANEQLSRLAHLDGLTEIPNRRCFDDALVRECSRVARSGMPLTLLIIDIDHFKHFNDEYGHQVGDTCLKLVAATIRRSVLRPADLIARYGGEEFVVLLPNTHSEGGCSVYERIQGELLTLNGMDMVPTISAGMATVNANIAVTSEVLLASADKALYQAKHAGRNRLKQCVISETVVA